MFRGVRALGYDMVIDVTDMQYLNLALVVQLLQRRAGSVWEQLDFCPRTCPSHYSRLCTYAAWFARPPHCPKRSLLMLPVPASCLRKFLRFRMGCHGLPRDIGSWSQIPRADRHCVLCGPGSYGDEKHLVFECPHVQPLRDKYAHLFSCTQMIQFLWQGDLIGVVKFVSEGLDIMLGADSDDMSQTSDQP